MIYISPDESESDGTCSAATDWGIGLLGSEGNSLLKFRLGAVAVFFFLHILPPQGIACSWQEDLPDS
jgi:hypothetical protein